MERVKGKVALITGGAQGIGEAAAVLLAKEGAKIVIGARKEDKGKKVAERIKSDGGEAIFVKQDVTSEDDWKNIIEKTLQTFGKLDILVNNAGIIAMKNLEEATFAESKRVMEVNWGGVFLGNKYGIEAMKKSGGGSIINCSSVAGLIGSAMDPVYGASKGAVLIFTKCVALHCCEAGYNIRVNNICPGFTWTPTVESEAKRMGKGDVEAGRKVMAGLNPIGRVAMPGEIAQGILYLASDESSFVTGAELVMDGGFTAT